MLKILRQILFLVLYRIMNTKNNKISKENNLKNVDLSNHDRIHYYLYRDIPKLIVDKDAKKYRYGMDFYEYRLIKNNNQIFNQNKLKKKFNKYLLMKIDDK